MPPIAGLIAVSSSLQNAILTICITAWVLCSILFTVAAYLDPRDIATLRAQMRERAEHERMGVRTTYGMLTASAWLPLLAAYSPQNPGPAVAALADVVSGVGTNLLSNLIQGAYDKTSAPRKAEQEIAE